MDWSNIVGIHIMRIKQMTVAFCNSLSTKIRPIHFIHISLLISFLLALNTIFVVSDNLADGVISGKYFWFYGSMGLINFKNAPVVIVILVSH
jgi:hypothetical protein